MGIIPVRLEILVGTAIVLIVGFLFYRHSLIMEGERIKQAAQVQAAKEQKARDDLVAKGVVDDLNTQIALLSNAALTGVPDIPGKLRIIRPSQVPASGAPAEASGGSAGAGGVGRVQEGTNGGTDCLSILWPVLSDLTLAGGVEAAYLGPTRQWAMKQGK